MEMAQYDLLSSFQFIKSLTQGKIHYVGHSQGTTIMFASLADPTHRDPRIVHNIGKFAALGPAAYMSNVKTKFFVKLTETNPIIVDILKQVGIYGIFLP